MKIETRVILSCITIMIFSMIFSQRIVGAEEQQWQPIPKANYAEVLQLIASRSKANYDKISSWQGRMDIFETRHHYGRNAAEMANADPNSIVRDSQHIFEEIRNTAEFTVDVRNDKLYCKKEKPQVRLRSVDLNQDVPARKNGGYESVRTILTREQYIWYMPDCNFSSMTPHVRAGKMAFIERPEERKFSLSGDIRDPRIFFDSSGEDGKKLWDTLLRIRSNIEERMKEQIAGYPHIEISTLETSTGIKYRIRTNWRVGENNVVGLLLEVDEAISFNAAKSELISPIGVIGKLKEYTYEKIAGVYVPKTVKKELRNNKDEPTFTSEITIETTGVNRQLPEDMFSIDNLGIEDGALVTDKIKKAEFRFSKGSLVPISDPNR